MRFDRDGFSVEAARKKKRKLPDWYLDEPPEPPGAGFFYDAFADLMTERRDGGAIPWSKAMAYADRKGLLPDVADVLWTVIKKMDSAERGWQLKNPSPGAGGG